MTNPSLPLDRSAPARTGVSGLPPLTWTVRSTGTYQSCSKRTVWVPSSTAIGLSSGVSPAGLPSTEIRAHGYALTRM